MLTKKQEMLTIVGLAIIVGITFAYKSYSNKTLIQENESFEMTYDLPIDSELIKFGLPSLLDKESLAYLNNEEILAIPLTMTFSKAFAKARKESGPGSLFSWNGQTYTTSFSEELTSNQKTLIDTNYINIVMSNQVKLKNEEE